MYGPVRQGANRNNSRSYRKAKAGLGQSLQTVPTWRGARPPARLAACNACKACKAVCRAQAPKLSIRSSQTEHQAIPHTIFPGSRRDDHAMPFCDNWASTSHEIFIASCRARTLMRFRRGLSCYGTRPNIHPGRLEARASVSLPAKLESLPPRATGAHRRNFRA